MATEGLKLGRAWDDTFRGWTDELQLGRKYAKPASGSSGSSSGWTGATVAARASADYSGKGSKADVHARLAGIARGSRQVMVKITPGQNKSMRAVREHLEYIAREGDEAAIDQDGNHYTGTAAVADLAWSWQHAGPVMPNRAESRLAFNIMFSMPEGTDERALNAAVRATSAAEFAGHQWVMVQHFDQPQVHCHVCVKAEATDGVRLNPRKADLQRWRDRFAHELRVRGIEAEATRRASRMHQKRLDKPWEVTRIEQRGMPANQFPSTEVGTKAEKWVRTEKLAASLYDRIIDALQRSDKASDRMLGKELATSVVGAKVKRIVKRDIEPERDI